MSVLITVLLGACVLFVTTAFHYEAIAFLDGRLRRHVGSVRRLLPLVVTVMVCAHIVEIGLYAMAFALGAGPLAIGHFRDTHPIGVIEYFYFAAEAYSSFGYGDIIPTRGLRLIASVAPLNGLLLLAWSGSFLYAAVHQRRQAN